MARWLKEPSALPEGLSLFPSTHTGKSQLNLRSFLVQCQGRERGLGGLSVNWLCSGFCQTDRTRKLKTPYLHQHIVPRLSSDLLPRVSDILHLRIREDHLKVCIIPATQVGGRTFAELQKTKTRMYASVSSKF